MNNDFTLERRPQENTTPTLTGAGATVMLTPRINEDYWSYRVKLNDRQAIIAFPKFGTIGIGFAREDDWNTNLPYTCQTLEILSHIWHNVDSGKPPQDDGYDPDDDVHIFEVHAAIAAIQQAIGRDHPELDPPNSQAVYQQPRVTDPLHP